MTSIAHADSHGLWLPRLTYQRHDGATVELIGMCHAADADFYASVQNRLHYADTVTYEGVSRVPDRARLNPTQIRAIDTLRSFLRASHRIMAGLNLTSQNQAIQLRDEWTRTDLDELTFARLIGTRPLARLRMITRLINAVPDEANDGITRDRIIDGLAARRGPIKTFIADLMLPQRIVLERRNTIAATGILDAATPESTVVSTWGAAHLPGIQDRLTAAGFTPTGRTDHLAIARESPVAHE